MSANEETPDLPKVTGSGFDLLHDGSNIVDTQMTFSLTSVEEDNIEDLPETPQSEEMSSFQSARERNERLNAARNTTTPGGQRNGGWRLDNPPTSSGFTPPFGSYPPPPNAFAGAPGMADVYNTPHLLDRTYISGEASVPLSAIAPGPVYPTETQLGLAYGYGIRRDDGSYTRLIRADELEELDTIPKFQGPEGLIILPPTRQLSPRRRQGPDAMISGDVSFILHPRFIHHPH
jgi:hypothetical protein